MIQGSDENAMTATQVEAIVLLPCPCCGCEAVELVESYSYGSPMFNVRCGNCMMRTERGCGKEKVLGDWNRRDGDKCSTGCKIKRAIHAFVDSLGQ